MIRPTIWFCLITVYSLMFGRVMGQTHIRFIPTLQGVRVEPNLKQVYDSDSISIDVLKFYVGNIQFKKNDSIVHLVQPDYFLIDVAQPVLTIDSLPNHEWTHMSFNIGVDSNTHNKALLQGDLDPIYGMYWAWQSGYIQLKLEGYYFKKTGESIPFQFHIGGTYAPFCTTQYIELPLAETKTINLPIHLDAFFKEALRLNPYKIMSPRKESLTLSKLFSHGFKGL